MNSDIADDGQGFQFRRRLNRRRRRLLHQQLKITHGRLYSDFFQDRQNRRPPERYVLVMDQGEELFTMNKPDEARAFARALATSVSEKLLMIGSLRSDLYGAFQDSTELFKAAHKIDILPMTSAEFKEAIERPTAHSMARFEEPDIPEKLAAEVDADPGALPLLSYLLEDAWKKMQHRADGVLRWSDLGG
jgi:hypothetical protein